MAAKDLLVDDGRDGQAVEAVCEGFPKFDVVTPFTYRENLDLENWDTSTKQFLSVVLEYFQVQYSFVRKYLYQYKYSVQVISTSIRYFLNAAIFQYTNNISTAKIYYSLLTNTKYAKENKAKNVNEECGERKVFIYKAYHAMTKSYVSASQQSRCQIYCKRQKKNRCCIAK